MRTFPESGHLQEERLQKNEPTSPQTNRTIQKRRKKLTVTVREYKWLDDLNCRRSPIRIVLRTLNRQNLNAMG